MLVLIKYYMSVEQGTEELSDVFEFKPRDEHNFSRFTRNSIRSLPSTVFSLSIEIFLKNLWRDGHNRAEHKKRQLLH